MNRATTGVAPALPITRQLQPVSAIDTVIFGEQDWLSLTDEQQNQIRLRIVREAYGQHLEACGRYAAFAGKAGVKPESIQEPSDLARIPQFPTSVLKRQQLLSVPLDRVVSSFTSSGTSGVRSTVYRDEVTLYRLTGMMRPDSQLFGDLLTGVDDEDSEVLNLGPSRQDAGRVWFSYVMSLLEQVVPMRSYLVGEELRLDAAVADLRQALAEKQHVVLVGPPFLVKAFCELAARGHEPVRGSDRLIVFTGGGWKSLEHERLTRPAFDALVRSSLGVENPGQIRDVFNQVELNTLFVECERHEKHVPPWVHAFARDPSTFAALPAGQPGLLCFSDASANSYPCFIIGDDLGRVRSGLCACGREGVRVEIERRLLRTTHEGCAESIRSATVSAPMQ